MKEIELKNLRREREKHFLQENGEIIAMVYNDNIHFKKNGKYEEIDNTIIKNNEYYTNTSNEYKVYFKENSSNELMKIEEDNHYLEINLLDSNDVPIKKEEKINDSVKYENILNGVDLEYKVLPTKVKENIIINTKESILDKLSFLVNTDLDLVINNDKSISAVKDNKIIFKIESPYMIDSNNNINNNLYYKLIKENNNYKLELILDNIWLENAKYPVIIDPTISNKGQNCPVYDTYIYPEDNSINRNSQDILKVGVERINGQDRINRTLIKFGLPTIGTGSQVISAELSLVGYVLNGLNESDIVNIHRVTEDWNEEEANWNTMYDKFDPKVESSFDSVRSYTLTEDLHNEILVPRFNVADITSLVKKWYSDTPNFGILLKLNKEIYKSDIIPAFYSKNNKIIGDTPEPVLIIAYRNQNGLEDYMDYQSQGFTDGSAYVNTYNGNLTTMFNIGSTIGGKMPTILSIFYNTNDVILENNNGIGIGYKFNLYQTIKETMIENIKYLEYVDADGTLHYFKSQDNDDIFIDEDGLNMKISIDSMNYILEDKLGNKYTFNKKNDIGYLTSLENVKGDKNNIIYNDKNLITKVIDANGCEINIIYETNKITITSPNKTTYINYNNNKISNVTTLTGITTFNYNDKGLISSITDVTGKKISYEYYDEIPYRVKKVSEYGLNNEPGGFFNIEYNFNSTTLIDNKNMVVTKTFNNNGNLVSISNLSSKNNIKNAYGRKQLYNQSIDLENEINTIKNKLLGIDIPNKYIKNYLTNTSFENDIINFTGSGINLSITDEEAFFGLKSLKIINNKINNVITRNISVPKGNNYTFSSYIKTNGNVQFALSYKDKDNNLIENGSDIIKSNNEFERYEVTINYPSDALSDLTIKIYLKNSGTSYIDGIQLEEGETANNYNLIENSDFSNGLGDWDLFVNDINTFEELPVNDTFEVVDINDLGDKALKINMDVTKQSSISKEYKVNGKGGDTYNISFWYKNSAFPTTGIPGNPINNEVSILFKYLNSETGHGLYGFTLNPNDNDWQYFSQSFTAERDFDILKLNFYQQKNANNLYITNICLFKDVRSVKYNYDNNGNIIKTTGLNNASNEFNYNKNNQLIQMLNPKGKKFNFEYDNIVTDRLINGISDFGISNQIKYDENGNPIVTNIHKNIINNLVNGLYKIRLKGTNNYIRYIKNQIQISSDNCNHDLFYLEKIGEYYSIKHSIIQNKYLTIKDSNVLLSSYDNDNSLFSLIKNENGSYYIETKVGNKYLKYDNNTLVVNSSELEKDYNYEFYFETIDSDLFIENSAEYTSDGKFMKSTTDTLFNKTLYDIDPTTGLIKNITNSKNQVTNYEYDNKQRLISVSNNNKKVNYSYNSNNMLENIEQGNKIYKFIYDEFLNTKQIKLNDITLVNNNYEENNGNLISSTYGNNQTINYSYDELDRISKVTKMDDTYKYLYDNNGNVVKLISNDSIVKYVYDTSKRIKEYSLNNFKIKYLYDIHNNIINTKYTLDTFENNIENIIDSDDTLIKTKFNNKEINYIYDDLGRLISSNINNIFNKTYEYVTNGNRTSCLIKNNKIDKDIYSYKYDKLNNITHIYLNNKIQNKYYYDEYNELIKEKNYITNENIEYKYDNSGNLLSKKITDLKNYNFIKEDKYEYNNTNFEDQLTKFNNDVITYDEIGNPIKIGNNVTLNWINGRQLKSYKDLDNTINYKYNKDGIRISKKINNKETKYYLEGKYIILEKTDNNVLYYMYNNLNELFGFKYNDEIYYYIKNIQDDIIGILDSNHNVIVRYTYDSWGNIISIKDNNGNDISSNNNHIGNINPFRYRSYYYDRETNLYYLNSRYYNPVWGRFINADGIIGSEEDINGYNLYMYCNNNPVINIDSDGHFAIPLIIPGIVFGIGVIAYTYSKAKKVVSDIINVAASIIDDYRDRTQLKIDTNFAEKVNEEVIVKETTITMTPYVSQSKPCTDAYVDWNIQNVIRGRRLTIDESVITVKSGNSVMCDYKFDAERVARQAGINNNYIFHNKHRNLPGYYEHYHAVGTPIHTHIWYLY